MLSKYLTESRYLVSSLPYTDRHQPCLRTMVDIQHVSIGGRSQSVMWKNIFLGVGWRIDYQGTRLWPKTSFLILSMLQYRRLESFFPRSVTQMPLCVREWSPTFLIPGTDSWKTIFPWTESGQWFQDDSRALHLLCTLFLLLVHQFHLESSSIRSQSLGVPDVEESLKRKHRTAGNSLKTKD